MRSMHQFSDLPLAFGIISPWLLIGGLLLSGLPVLIHLLYRQRHRERSWAAMQFLREAVRRQARRVRLEALLLLVVRTLMLLFVALALAQPYLERVGGAGDSSPAMHRVLVIDASLSMAYAPEGESALERARQIAKRIVQTSHPGDAFHLVRLCESPPQILIRRPAYERAEVLAELDRLSQTQERGDVLSSLRQVVALMGGNPPGVRSEIIVLSDLQSADWLPPGEPERAQLRAALRELAASGRLVFVDVGASTAENAAITGLRAARPPGAVSGVLPLEVELHNFGSVPLTGRSLELLVDGRPRESRTVDLPPHTTVAVSLPLDQGDGVEAVVAARLTDDSLPLDNRRSLVLPGRAPLDVLLVSGRPRVERVPGAADFVLLALDPGRRYRGAADSISEGVFHPRLIGDGELRGIELSRFDCVWLCDVPMLTDAEARLLSDYVHAGGGLVVSLGDEVRAASYNQWLYRDGRGLLPARLLDVASLPETAEDGFHFEPGQYEHPVVRPFAGNTDAGLLTTQIFRYYRTELPGETVARTALSYSSGDPAIIEQPFGAGRVMLVTTSLDDRWGNWALWPSFVPMVHEMTRLAGVADFDRRHLRVGQSIVRRMSAAEFGANVELVPPGEAAQPLTVQSLESGQTVATEPLAGSGVYQLRISGPSLVDESYAVNVDTAESDLTRLDRAALASELGDAEFAFVNEWPSSAALQAEYRLSRSSLSRWFLLAALCLLLIEQLMAWRFLYGFVALYGVVSTALVRQTAHVHLVLAVLLAVLLVAGLALLLRRFIRPPDGRT